MREITNKGLRALTTSRERQEIRAALNGKEDTMKNVKLQYIGKMEWGDKYGIDSRMWNVLSPALEGYPTGPLAGKPTLTLQGLKEKGLLRWF